MAAIAKADLGRWLKQAMSGQRRLPELRWVMLVCLLLAFIAMAMLPGNSQNLPVNTEQALQQMTAQAAVIFAGEVVAIHISGQVGNTAAEASSESVVEITLRVDDAVRGCAAGGNFVLREWGGLWVNGVGLNGGTGMQARYRIGQRAVFLLYGSAAGLASPVGGMDGVLPLSGSGAGEVVDLRWVQTHIARPQSVLLKPVTLPVSGEAISPNQNVLPDTESMLGAAQPIVTPIQERAALQSALEASVVSSATLLAMLHQWELSHVAQ